MNFDYQFNPYPSKRSTVFAKRGMIATSQPLAAQAGLSILQKGGNAIDAAIATAACLTVVEPTSNGIGGDAFALVWTDGKLHGLNASGRAPQSISLETVKKLGYQEMPKFGAIPVTVPGAPAAWKVLSERFGKLPFSDLLEPAIRYAEEGYVVSPVLAKNWAIAFRQYREKLSAIEFEDWYDTFTVHGRAPKAGEIWRSEGHAKTLRQIAETKAEEFYRGELAEKIASYVQRLGGFLQADDFASYHPEWVEPIHVNYRGYDVWELPPNGQGLITLLALQILKGFELREKDSEQTYHLQIEALKLAFEDGKRYLTDPAYMTVQVKELLSDSYAEERRKQIGESAIFPTPGIPPAGGTVYLATADGEGNMVSFIQSNYTGFGSGLVVPGTGIALQNRGNNFSLDPNHDNCLEPGKRPYHTIIPGFLTKEGKPVGPFGVMGGFMQPQGHLQVVSNTVDFGLNPQAALDAPRWKWREGKIVDLERTVPDHIVQALIARGHQIHIAPDSTIFGRGQIIWRLENGAFAGGTEPRTDGQVAGW